MTTFFKLTLRTSDVAGARGFYTALLGTQALDVVQLHEQAVARGARPHWLGYLDVDDVDSAAAAFVSRGATPLGPKWVNPQGLEAAVVRDPGGAIVALAKPLRAAAGEPSGATTPEIASYVLNTADVERACANYQELFGWALEPAKDWGPLGVLHPFAWERGGAPVGFMVDISGRPEVHPHWLFHFRVDSITHATALVREAGGAVIGPLALPSGERVAVCDDPQGAAFGLMQRA